MGMVVEARKRKPKKYQKRGETETSSGERGKGRMYQKSTERKKKKKTTEPIKMVVI